MPSDVSRAPNRNWAFCGAFFDELARSGVRDVCICPGSRSAPLAASAANQGALRCWSWIDERSAGFFALGLAKTSRAPVALLCTSGSAAANFHPAVVEACYAGVPLIVLTADRPPELRAWGAGQSIDQLRLYGPHVRWFAEVALPEATSDVLCYARALACRSVDAAAGAPAGPVHLNFPLREPLDPRCVPGDVDGELDALAARGRGQRPYARIAHGIRSASEEQLAALAADMQACERGVIACGPQDAEPALAARLAALAERLSWPLLAEPTSQLRNGPHVATAPVIAHTDLLLRDEAFASRQAPAFVLQLGLTPSSKAFRLWLEHRPPPTWVRIDPDANWCDPSHLASEVLRMDPQALCDGLLARLAARGRSSWCEGFLAADRQAERALEAQLGADDSLLEAGAVRELAASLPESALLYVSNSMPVRDIDAFLPASTRRLRVLCNRGANGIDGMLSSALGAAAAHAGPVCLLSGDLALVHDCAALLAGRRHALRLVIVLLDNDGGGIFSLLPIARFGDAVQFERHFRTPHGLDLEPVCRGMGADFARVRSVEHLRAALKDACEAPGVSVLCVPVDRDRNLAQLAQIDEAVRAGLASAAEAGGQ
jgi:2-succinyl-5-enolpyruvyl-6-hydroxy-3-cyclohexene-1-carboxylate synthase